MHRPMGGQHRHLQVVGDADAALDVQRLDRVDDPFRGGRPRTRSSGPVRAPGRPPPRSAAPRRPARAASTAAATGSNIRASRSWSTPRDQQVRAAGLGVPAALADVHPLGAGRGRARLHPVRVEHRDRVGGRPVRLPGGRHRRPVRAPDDDGPGPGPGHGIGLRQNTSTESRRLNGSPCWSGRRVSGSCRGPGRFPRKRSGPPGCRHGGNRGAVGPVEHPPAGRSGTGCRVNPSSCTAVVALTQQHQVTQIGRSAVRPVHDMMGVQEPLAGTAGELAAAVPEPQRPPQRRRNLAGLAAQFQLLARIHRRRHPRDQRRIARQPPRRRRGQARAVLDPADRLPASASAVRCRPAPPRRHAPPPDADRPRTNRPVRPPDAIFATATNASASTGNWPPIARPGTPTRPVLGCAPAHRSGPAPPPRRATPPPRRSTGPTAPACRPRRRTTGPCAARPDRPVHPLGLAVPADHLLQLRRRMHQRLLQQRRLVHPVRNPGHRPHLRVRQRAPRERLVHQRQPGQRGRHPHVLPSHPRTHRTRPRQPMRHRPHPPLRPPLAPVELRHQTATTPASRAANRAAIDVIRPSNTANGSASSSAPGAGSPAGRTANRPPAAGRRPTDSRTTAPAQRTDRGSAGSATSPHVGIGQLIRQIRHHATPSQSTVNPVPNGCPHGSQEVRQCPKSISSCLNDVSAGTPQPCARRRTPR